MSSSHMELGSYNRYNPEIPSKSEVADLIEPSVWNGKLHIYQCIEMIDIGYILLIQEGKHISINQPTRPQQRK